MERVSFGELDCQRQWLRRLQPKQAQLGEFVRKYQAYSNNGIPATAIRAMCQVSKLSAGGSA